VKVMELANNNPGIKFPTIHRSTKIKNVTSLLDVNMNFKEFKNDIVLNIRIDGNQLADFFRYIAEKSFSEDFSLVDQNNEGSVKELAVNEKDLTPELWIDDVTYLTCREVEIMEKLSKGWLYKEIADDLGLKFNTVRNHLQNIYPKLKVGNRSEAIIEYLKSREKYKKISSDE
jgi:DNA-binding CsgD family transcriptional regulator